MLVWYGDQKLPGVDLERFVTESNLIEGITRPPTPAEIEAHITLATLDRLTVEDLQAFVTACQPGAVLRDRVGLDVCVGFYLPPLGGPAVRLELAAILDNAKRHGGDQQGYEIHIAYELLHPFMDGNGRSGRALWLWCRDFHAPLGFLHTFYYETLRAMG